MFGLPFVSGDIPSLELEGYTDRCERAVEMLAKCCGMDAAREVDRFRWCRERLGKQATTNTTADLFGQITQAVGGMMPLIYEFVLTYSGDGPKGFAYLTQGRPGASLPDNLAGLLSGTLQMQIEDRGSEEEAAILADMFRLAFPDIAALAQFSALAQGMIVGVAPAGEKIRLKIYFNTRLDPSGAHREKVGAMLQRCGLDDQGMYAALYADVEGSHFHGIGVDLDGDGSRRAKLYVRVPQTKLLPTLRGVASRLGSGDNADAATALIEPVQQMIGALDGTAMADEVELAAALRDDGEPTLKVTVFFASAHVEDADTTRVANYLESLDYNADPVREAITVLGEGHERASAQKHPLHGVGIELPVGARPKINIYAQPVI